MNRYPESQRNVSVRRARDTTALSRLALLLFCGLVLAGGFIFAAKQHFAAVQYGYQSESLRVERKKLLEERQRLSLERERVTAPAKLEPAARQLGLQPTTAGQLGPGATVSHEETASVEKSESQTEIARSQKSESTRSAASR